MRKKGRPAWWQRFHQHTPTRQQAKEVGVETSEKSPSKKDLERIEAGKEDTLSPHIEEEAPSVSLHEGFDERVYIPIGDGAAMLRSHGVLT
jgi:hypothetical protein